MKNVELITDEEIIDARLRLMKKEKAYTHMRDELSEERRKLPWKKITENYVFDTPNGKQSLSELFDGRSQLIIYHFMWRWDLQQGCVGCSFLADHVDGANTHLQNHDISFVAVSRGPIAELENYKKRLGWKFKMVSSYGSSFNYDFHVSFTPEQIASGKAYYNYSWQEIDSEELPGLSVFYKNENGEIFHTYSCYARGNEDLLTTYMFLDYTPKGRDEEKDMDWVKRNDEYPNQSNEQLTRTNVVDKDCCKH